MQLLDNRFQAFISILRRFTHGDNVLLFLLLVLSGLSCFVLYSTSGQDFNLVLRHITRFSLGFALMFFLMQVPINLYRWWAPWFYGVCLLLLFLVFLFGDFAKGARRWLDIGFIQFQPSEIFKLAIPMMICYLFSEELTCSRMWKFILTIPVIVLPVTLVILQPDFGTAFLLGVSGVLVLFLAGLHWGWIVGFFCCAIGASPFIWHSLLAYQQQRLLTFLNPENDPFGASYHIIQSKIAVGSGGIWGKGWLNGTQSQLDFLPERSTDFIFAAFAEEFGFVGVGLLFFIYSLILARGLRIALHAHTDFERFLAAGLTLALFVYFAVNVGMVSGLVPVVGAPLPLMSYGGTSTVTLFAAFGMLMAIYQNRPLMRKDVL